VARKEGRGMLNFFPFYLLCPGLCSVGTDGSLQWVLVRES
jgi:hypothetical protein